MDQVRHGLTCSPFSYIVASGPGKRGWADHGGGAALVFLDILGHPRDWLKCPGRLSWHPARKMYGQAWLPWQ